MNCKIFISVGTACTESQRLFVEALINWLRTEGVDPVVLGKTVYPDKQPLKFIQERMSECDGTLVVAFERIFVNDGVEKRGGADKKELSHQIIPTVWNQIETAMAYGLEQPILVLSEEGSRREGLLDQCFDWLVFPVKVEEGAVEKRAFVETLRGWFKQVEGHKKAREIRERKIVEGIDPGSVSILTLLSIIRPRQLWLCISAAIVLGSLLCTAAFTLGQAVGKIAASRQEDQKTESVKTGASEKAGEAGSGALTEKGSAQ